MAETQEYFELKKVVDTIVVSLTQAEITNEVYIDALLEHLLALIRSKPNIKLVLSLEKIDFMFSYMLGKFSILFSEARMVGGEIKLCKIKGMVFEMMRIAKIDVLFEMYKTEEEAVASF
jgi:anti-anti-sigma factor